MCRCVQCVYRYVQSMCSVFSVCAHVCRCMQCVRRVCTCVQCVCRYVECVCRCVQCVCVGVCRCVRCVFTCVQTRVFMEAEMSESTTALHLTLETRSLAELGWKQAGSSHLTVPTPPQHWDYLEVTFPSFLRGCWGFKLRSSRLRSKSLSHGPTPSNPPHL